MPEGKIPYFIHIPKTGGLSIERALRHVFPEEYRRHSLASNYKIDRSNSFTFAFVRNPYDRVLSAHQYLVNGIGNDKDTEYGKTIPKDFKLFVKSFLTQATRVHYRPMLNWIDKSVDFIGRFENLQTDFNIVCKIINTDPIVLPHHNKGIPRSPYQEYYDTETKNIVEKVYKKDLEYFEYQF